MEQPVIINFVYDHEDKDELIPCLNALRKMLSRDGKYSISHRLDIPTFVWEFTDFPSVRERMAKKAIYFFFVGMNVAGGESRQRVEELMFDDWEEAYLVALDNKAFEIDGYFHGRNALRLFDWKLRHSDGTEDYQVEKLLLNVAKDIYKCMVNEKASLSIFLSHAKSDSFGVNAALAVRNYINCNTTMREFFDATSIEDGDNFEKRIKEGLKDVAVICFQSDHYHDSMWCGKEVLLAKQNDLPMVLVDCSLERIDRLLPYLSNIPSLRPKCRTHSGAMMIDEFDSLKVVLAITIESLRHAYALQKLEAQRDAGVLPKDAVILSRPPEPFDVLVRLKDYPRPVYYPEPPMMTVERCLYEGIGFDLRTVTSDSRMYNRFEGVSVGISVSEPSSIDEDDISHIGRSVDDIKNLVTDLSRALLFRNAGLIYGGDLQDREGSNFTWVMVEEWRGLMKRYGMKLPKLKNYVAWTLQGLSSSLEKSRMSDYQTAVEKICVAQPTRVLFTLKEVDGVYPAATGEDLFVWAKSLTKMREESIAASNVRICAGGKRYGAKGRMPGVLEEILIAVKANKPLYLMGGFGGICQDVADIILDRKDKVVSMTTAGQIENTKGYAEFVNTAKFHGDYIDIEAEAKAVLTKAPITTLANNAGLTLEEYKLLLTSPFADECITLVLNGLEKCYSKSIK